MGKEQRGGYLARIIQGRQMNLEDAAAWKDTQGEGGENPPGCAPFDQDSCAHEQVSSPARIHPRGVRDG